MTRFEKERVEWSLRGAKRPSNPVLYARKELDQALVEISVLRAEDRARIIEKLEALIRAICDR